MRLDVSQALFQVLFLFGLLTRPYIAADLDKRTFKVQMGRISGRFDYK
jgi:hypothetical protein